MEKGFCSFYTTAKQLVIKSLPSTTTFRQPEKSTPRQELSTWDWREGKGYADSLDTDTRRMKRRALGRSATGSRVRPGVPNC